MAKGLQVWSATAATNNTIDSSVNWQEGQAPSSVNDSARAMMASAAQWLGDTNGTLVTTGSSAAFTVTSNQGSTANIDGQTITVNFHATADTSATLNRDATAAAAIQLVSGTNLAGGELLAGTSHRFRYSSSSTAWLKIGHEVAGSIPNSIVTANLTDNAVTYRKLQSETDNTILGNAQGNAFPAQEITLGQGLTLNTVSTSTSQAAFTSTSTSTAISFTLTAAFPPIAAFSNLSVKVASNTTVTGAADYVTLFSTSGSVKTLPVSGTINMAASGAKNELDTGSLASGTFYATWAIATSTSTVADMLGSASFTAPTMPTGYIYKARIGAVVTSTSTASQQLMGTWQFGRKAQYVVGLAQTSVPPLIATSTGGAIGTFSVTSPVLATASISGVAPNTASQINVLVTNDYKNVGANAVLLAPNVNWGGTNNGPQGTNGLLWPLYIQGAGPADARSIWMTLEATTVSWAVNSTGGALACMGWEDNL